MKILVPMAGEAMRFIQKGIHTPKPMFQIDGLSILERTTRSIPFIQHYGETTPNGVPSSNLYFAVRQEHEEKFAITKFLREIYGTEITVVYISQTTRGNLETAFILSHAIPIGELHESVLIMDCDNQYNNNNLIETLEVTSRISNSQVVCCFTPIDNSSKWSFVISNDGKLVDVVEKDPTALQRGGMPIIGTFWFSSGGLFYEHANTIIHSGERVGAPDKEEFYMSQAFLRAVRRGYHVITHEVKDVVPLGTPEDVDRYTQKNNK